MDQEAIKDQEAVANQKMEAAVREFLRSLHDDCPGSIIQIPLKFESCDARTNTLLLSIMPEPWMRNQRGFMHGGIIATIFDTAVGTLTHYNAEGRPSSTLNLSVSYIRPVVLDQKLMVRTHTEFRGHTIVHTTARAWNEGREDKPLAAATASYYIFG